MATTTTSYANLLAFLLTTLFYYLALKPSLKLEQLQNQPLLDNYTKSSYMYLAIYFLAVLVIQLLINISVISTMCGGNITQNIGYSAFVTFLPWILIFGVLIVVCAIYPAFQKIFADVFGYYFVASSANTILTELLINKDIQKNIDKDPNVSPEEKTKMQDAADMILKICGNTSVLINQITPANFLEYWTLLRPLMKSKYQSNITDTTTTGDALDLQKRLFELVVTKDNVGQASWFIYTGIILVSLVQLKIATRGCVNNTASQQANYKAFLEQEKDASAKKELAQSTVYTISS